MAGEVDRPLKIGEVAARLGLSEATLRFYERAGLVKPTRTAGGTRQYHAAHVRRIAAIAALARAGVPLEEIRAIMEARERGRSGDEASEKVGEQLGRRLEDIRRKRRTLQELERELEHALKLVRACRGCANRPDSIHCPDCPVNRHLGENPLLDLFWE